MASPITTITKYIKEYKFDKDYINIDEFKKQLYKANSIMSKYYDNEKLLILYHKFNLSSNSQLENECRSLIIDTNTMNIVSYSCPIPILNKDAQRFLLNNNDLKLDIYRCYEGSVLSLFNHNNKWFLSTRRSLDCKLSTINDSNYYDLFMDVLISEDMTFTEFTSRLDHEYGYCFVLIHHKNKLIIDYTHKFGENYTKLCLISTRSKYNQIEVEDSIWFDYKNIFKPAISDMEELSVENQALHLNIREEGIIIKTVKDNIPYLLKLQTNSYQFCRASGPDTNIFKGYLFLYQNDKLKRYIEENIDHKNLDKTINPHNINETFDTIVVIDSVFKVLASEFFELYKLLWKFGDNKHLNIELYNILPKEYKDILYKLRGLYYKNRLGLEKKMFGIGNIVQHLRLIDVDHICAVLKQRKLLFSQVSHENTSATLLLFKSISNRCNKLNIKLTAICTNKLFPDSLTSN